MKTFLAILILSSSVLFASQTPEDKMNLPYVGLTKEEIRKKNISDLRVLTEELYNDLREMNVRLIGSDAQLSATRIALAESHNAFDTMKAWGIQRNDDANNAEAKFWKEQQKHKETLKKLLIWKSAGSGLAAIIVFILVLQFTQYMMPPYSILVPAAAAVAVAGGIWIFL